MLNQRSLEIQVVGGLGNQLFGLAAGLVLARTLNLNPVVNLERVCFGSNLSRRPDLQNIDLETLEGGITFVNSRKPISSYLYERIRRSSRNFLPVLVKHSEPEYLDSLKSPSEQIQEISRDTRSIGGPFMDFAWVELAKNHGFPTYLMPNIRTKQFLERYNIATKTEFAIHIRLGDYLKHTDIFPLAHESYYLDSLEYLGYQIDHEVHVFTDSPRLAREFYPKLFQLGGVQIVDSKQKMSPLETMSVMSRYPNLIASNSTFSSWAGWFNANKKVITPVPHHYNEWSDTLPSHWVRMDIT
jgi:hypothetical protein